uniref:Uncharacterized protein n=1 Tax=Cacopsylla melanoneura TaxID=428564 RepID=A0A8D8PKR6_9HEMI
MVSNEIRCLLLLTTIFSRHVVAFVYSQSDKVSRLNVSTVSSTNASVVPKNTPNVISVFLQVQEVLLRLVEMMQGVVKHLMSASMEEDPTLKLDTATGLNSKDSALDKNRPVLNSGIPILSSLNSKASSLDRSSHIQGGANISNMDSNIAILERRADGPVVIDKTKVTEGSDATKKSKGPGERQWKDRKVDEDSNPGDFMPFK